MKYSLHTIDKIKVLILDSTGKNIGIALYLEGRTWNIFTPDLSHLGRTEAGKGDILRTYQELTGRANIE